MRQVIVAIDPLPETSHGPAAKVTAFDVHGDDQHGEEYTFTVRGEVAVAKVHQAARSGQ
jgi:hypothetical protein